MPLQLHWHEGLFLQPHHFQRLQKGVNDLFAAERQLRFAYPYGLVEARISVDELESMRLRFDRLHAIMPSGVEVRFPQEAELPSMDIRQAFASTGGNFTVYLGVPLWFAERANTLPLEQNGDSRAKLMYRLAEAEFADENSGDNAKPMLMRRINARLMLEHEDRSDMETIPLLRIVRGAGEDVGLPKQDPEFVGPCLILNGSPVLRELVRDLASQVVASRQELVVQLTRAGFSLENLRGLQFEQLMRLRTLNRFGGTLPSLVEAPRVEPFSIYLQLRELLGELTALHPDRDEFDVPAYNHDSPYLGFAELSSKIRGLLRGAVAPSFIKLPFVETNGLLTAIFEDQHIDGPNEYFLGIRTTEDPAQLAALVEDADRFKLMPYSMAARAIRGVLLKEERFTPLELPSQSGLHFYRLLRHESARSWQQILTERAAVVRWTDHEADYEIALYMTVPPRGSDV